MTRSAFYVGFFGTLLIVAIVMLVLTWTWAFAYPPEAGLGVPDEAISEPRPRASSPSPAPEVFPWKTISALENDKDTYGVSGEQDCKALSPGSDKGVKVTVTFKVNRVELMRQNGEHWVEWQHPGDGPFAAVLLGEGEPVVLVRGRHKGNEILVDSVETYNEELHGNTCALILTGQGGEWQEVK